MQKRAILFPGQGAQDVGMGADFFREIPASRRIFETADEILGYRLSTLCFEGPLETLTRTDRAQVAIFVTSVAAISGLTEIGRFDRQMIRAAAGLSLGEYSALWFAKVFSFEDGLRLVRKRGEAMQRASEEVRSGMVSLLGADRALAEKVVQAARGDGVLVVANLNGPGQVVLSGDLEACGRVPEAAKALGVRRTIPLKVAGAFHSPLMAPAQRELEEALRSVTLRQPELPVYSNVTAAVVGTGPEAPSLIAALLAKQVVAPVLWEDLMRAMAKDGDSEFLEPPPGSTLTGLVRKILPEATATPLGLASTQQGS